MRPDTDPSQSLCGIDSALPFELQLPKNLRRPNQGPEALHHRCSRHLLLKREMIVVLAVAEWGQRRTPRVRDETLALRFRL